MASRGANRSLNFPGFVYGIGGQFIVEFDGSSGALKKEYVYGGGMQATIDATNGTQYMTSDNLGSPRVITNSSGSVVSRHYYLPYGEELGAGTGGRTTGMGFSGSGDNNRKKFTGYERDNETGLDYAQARYFSSSQGRFISPDPFQGSASAGSPQTFNRYAYVGNNPVNAVDPTGLAQERIPARPGADTKLETVDGSDPIADEEARYEAGIKEVQFLLAIANAVGYDPVAFSELTGRTDPTQQQAQNADAARTDGNQEHVKADQELGKLFTNGNGIVRGVSSIRNQSGRDTHNMLANGTVHTFHVYGDENAVTRTDLYVPKSFSKIEWLGRSAAIATDLKTGQVLQFDHVLKTRGQRPNQDGSRFIGQIGGFGAERPGDIHAHITLYRNRAARDIVESWRAEPTKHIVNNTPGFTRTIDSAHSQYVLDIRMLLRK